MSDPKDCYAPFGDVDVTAQFDARDYLGRTPRFRPIVAATHEHFWDPENTRYVQFDHPFDTRTQPIMPEGWLPECGNAVVQRIAPERRIAFANEIMRWHLSSLLHGEQGAFALSVSLCSLMRDKGTQEYAVNQAREEARHVAALTKYMRVRFGDPYPIGDTLRLLMKELIESRSVAQKIVGMQIIVEGAAMGAFAMIQRVSLDPLLVRLARLIMTDEVFHHRFGRGWAAVVLPTMSETERNELEDWAARYFYMMVHNLLAPDQRKEIYEEYGLDWKWVETTMLESRGAIRETIMNDPADLFRVVAKSLLNSGIVTKRSEASYAPWVDVTLLKRESDELVGQDVADATLGDLRLINQNHSRRDQER